MHRLFVALSLPDEIVDAIADLQAGIRGARWIAPDNFHMTLSFLGETDRHGLHEAASALSSIAAPQFDMRLKGCGYFGDRKPRALWTGAEANPALAHLQSKVCVALKRAGFAGEKRKFSPHVTIAYLSGVAQHQAAEFCVVHGLFSAGPFPVSEIHLFESHLGSESAHYEIVESFQLTAPAEMQAS